MKDNLEELLKTKDREGKIQMLTEEAKYILEENPRDVDIDYVKKLIVCMKDYKEIPTMNDLINDLKEGYLPR
ncbi:MAG: hypothetical protein AABX28_03100 [Nanoarchaeota archaeon]